MVMRSIEHGPSSKTVVTKPCAWTQRQLTKNFAGSLQGAYAISSTGRFVVFVDGDKQPSK